MNKMLILVVSLLTAVSSSVASESGNVKGAYFAVIVSDIEISSRWYQSVLGLDVQTHMQEEGSYDIVNLTGPGIAVELLKLEAAVRRPEGFIEGPFKVGVLVADLGGFVSALPDNMERPEIINDDRNRLLLIQLRDPDNHVVQIMQRNLQIELDANE